MTDNLDLRASRILSFLDERKCPDGADCEVNWHESRGVYPRIYPCTVKELRDLCCAIIAAEEQSLKPKWYDLPGWLLWVWAAIRNKMDKGRVDECQG